MKMISNSTYNFSNASAKNVPDAVLLLIRYATNLVDPLVSQSDVIGNTALQNFRLKQEP